jgi:hypothetical protein
MLGGSYDLAAAYSHHAAGSRYRPMRDAEVIDTGGSIHLYCNDKLVYNIRKSKYSIEVSTNNGILQINHIANVIGTDEEVWFDSRAVTNVRSFALTEQYHPITYTKYGFCVHHGNKKLYYNKYNNIYVRWPLDFIGRSAAKKQSLEVLTPAAVSMPTTVEENKSFYTPRQFERAKRARNLLEAAGSPSVEDLKTIIKMNLIDNNPVTIADVQLAEKIFGPDVATLKGKSTRRRPTAVTSDSIPIPPELIAAQHDVTLCIDDMFVNGEAFFTTISKNIRYRTAEWIKDLQFESHEKALRDVFKLYRRAGFKITVIEADLAFKPLLTELEQELGFTSNFANPGDHVSEAERSIRTMKERIRAGYHRLPYKRLPRLLLKTLVVDTPKKINYFPAKGGISKYFSPRAILHQRKLDYLKHCAIPFGTAVQAQQPTDNTTAGRMVDGIYLRHTESVQGGHEVMNLHTG